MMKKILLLLCVTFMLGLFVPRLTPAAEESPAWQDYPAKEAQRPITIGDNIWEIDIYVDSLSTDREYDEDGEIKDAYGAYNIFAAELALRYGLSRSWQMSVTAPYISGEIGDDTGGSIGDLRAGLTYELFLNQNHSMSFGSEFSVPTGLSDYHYELAGEEIRLDYFRTGDPGYNLHPAFAYRYRGDRISVRMRATGVFTGTGEIRFNQVKGFETKEDLDPGDGYRIRTGFYYQFKDKWAGGLFARYENISESMVDDEGLGDDNELMKLEPFVVYHATRQLDVSLGIGVPLYGRNNPCGYPVLIKVRSRF